MSRPTQPNLSQRGQSSPISLRLTVDERSRLESEAGSRTLSSHIRNRLFGTDSRRRRVRLPSRDDRLLGQILARLGQSGIAESLRELSDAARIGALPLTEENEATIISACLIIETMRSDLIRALGLIEPTGR